MSAPIAPTGATHEHGAVSHGAVSPESTAAPAAAAAPDSPATERWGDFVLTADKTLPRVTEHPASRADFPWDDTEGPWDHHLADITNDEAAARADGRVPFPAYVPATERFLVANVLADERGPAEVWLAFIEPSRGEIRLSRSTRPADGNDATLKIVWTLRAPRPLYLTAHNGPIPINAPSLDAATAVEDEIRKVTVRGQPGILRLWSGRQGQDMYGTRFPTVILNWFEGPVFWAVKSYFLSVDEVLRIAESIRPVE
ncbi:MAG: hypothetical protein ACR2HN_07320 [Tepidiformaceae bacterium]